MPTAQKPVAFFSTFQELRLVKKPRYKTIVEGQAIWSAGEAAEFHRGQFTTSDAEMIEWLRSHLKFGIDFYEREMPKAPAVEEAKADEEPPVVKPRKAAKKSAPKVSGGPVEEGSK